MLSTKYIFLIHPIFFVLRTCCNVFVRFLPLKVRLNSALLGYIDISFSANAVNHFQLQINLVSYNTHSIIQISQQHSCNVVLQNEPIRFRWHTNKHNDFNAANPMGICHARMVEFLLHLQYLRCIRRTICTALSEIFCKGCRTDLCARGTNQSPLFLF